MLTDLAAPDGPRLASYPRNQLIYGKGVRGHALCGEELLRPLASRGRQYASPRRVSRELGDRRAEGPRILRGNENARVPDHFSHRWDVRRDDRDTGVHRL